MRIIVYGKSIAPLEVQFDILDVAAVSTMCCRFGESCNRGKE
jgi:hypothetical protein